MKFHAVAVHHLQDNENILNGFAAQCLELCDDELLDISLNDVCFLAEGREKMVFQRQRVSRNCGDFDELSFVGFPHRGNLSKCFLFCHDYILK